MKKRYLLLENGSVYEGEAFGADVDIMAELVFNTGMSGYQESITDLSYRGEIIVFTYPLIGNYGVNCGARNRSTTKQLAQNNEFA